MGDPIRVKFELSRILPTERRRQAGIEDATRRALQYFVLPLWSTAGLADWWCHRRTNIEQTSGPTESLIHTLMMAEGGLATLLGLFLEVDAGVLGLTYGMLALHEATAIWDVAYADGRREITPTEQHVHGFLERVPMMAAAFLTVLHWDQARAVFGFGEGPDWSLRPKRQGLSPGYRATILGVAGTAGVLPYAEELVRCLRARRRDEIRVPRS